MENERHEVTVLGRPVGTAMGWDQVEDWSICVYAFEPSKEKNERSTLEAGTLTINYEKGKFQYFRDEDGELEYEQDIIGVLTTMY